MRYPILELTDKLDPGRRVPGLREWSAALELFLERIRAEQDRRESVCFDLAEDERRAAEGRRVHGLRA